MLRRALFVTPFLLCGCAAPHANRVIPADVANAWETEAPSAESMDSPYAATAIPADFALTQAPPPQAQPQPHPWPRQRFTIKSGYYGSSEDEVDDGYIILGSWLRPVTEHWSSEVEIGYLDASGSDKGVDTDVWGIPFMAGGRFTVPVGQKVELFAGLGLGTIYYDVEASTSNVSVSSDGFLFAGDGYFGGAIRLGKAFLLGFEGKYYVTDDYSDFDSGLEGYVAMLTLGFER